MEKKFYFFLSLFWLLGFSSFAQFQEVAQLSEYPLVAQNSEDQFGTSVASDGNYVVVGSKNYMDIGVVYVFYNNGLTYDTLALLSPSNGAAGDEFGTSVSIADDVIIVGAPENDVSGTSSGSAYVFVKPSSGWADMTETVQLTGSGITSNDDFGKSVSISISGDIIVVGAPIYGSTYTGAVLVYEKPTSAGGWEDVLAEPDAILYDAASLQGRFGFSVSISGDVIVVGGIWDDLSGTSEGAAWVFVKPGSNWADMTVPTAKLTADDTSSRDFFGTSVSVSGDIVVVGAPEHDVQATKAGAIYIYEKPSAGWSDMATQTQKFLISDGAAYHYFGYSVSISNNVIVAGASGASKAYVFEKSGDDPWAQTAALTASDSFSGDEFGKSVSINGDIVVVGAIYDDDHGTDSGSAYVFDNSADDWSLVLVQTAKLLPRKYNSTFYLKTGTSVAIDGNIAVVGMDSEHGNSAEVLEFDGLNWTKIAFLTPSDGVNGDKFGYAVDIYQDMIVVGAYKHATTGAAYVYVKPTTGWEDMTEDIKLTATDAAADDQFGYSVCVGSSYDELAYRVAVGASKDDGGKGAAYVFEKTGSSNSDLSQTGKLTASNGPSVYFGTSVDIDGNVLVVGAYKGFNSLASLTTGAAYVFVSTSASWGDKTLETAILLPSDGGQYDNFGQSVSISNDVIIVGSPNNDAVANNAGAAYIFEKPDGGWAAAADDYETVNLPASDAAAGDMFGKSVSISGNNTVVGAYYENSNQGSAYVFEKSSGSWATLTGYESAKLIATDGVSYDRFGNAVAIADNYILVGDFENDVDGSANAGSAYLFQASLTWTGTTSTDWHTTANWDFEVLPQNYDDVLIDQAPSNQPEITSSADCYDIELAATATLGLVSDASSTGSLIIGGAYTGAADVAYNRFVTGSQWHMVGSPLTGLAISDFLQDSYGVSNIEISGSDYKMKHYIESTDSWANDYTTANADDIELGQAYAITRATDGLLYFYGSPNTDAVNATLTQDGNAWNLLSNPFTSSIAATVSGTDADDYLLNAANVAVLDPSFAALYLWVEDITDRTNVDNYKVINNAASGSLVQDYLQVGQGFMVKSKSGGGSFEMTPTMQSHQTTAAFKNTASTVWTGITLIAENDNAKTSTHIAYQENMTRGLDVSYDAGLLSTNLSFSLYTKLIEDNGVDFMVQCLPTSYEDLIVPIGLDAEAGTVISFKAEVSNLPEDYVAVLEDRENGTFTAFETVQSVYTITLDEASTGTGRFYLRTSFKSALGANDLDQVQFSVYAQASSQQLIVNGSVDENTTAKVYDIRGKLVKSFDLQLGTQNRLLFNEQSGVYIIQIQNSKGIVSEKVNWVK